MNGIDLIKNYMNKGLTLKGVAKNMIGNNPVLNSLANMIEKGDTKSAEAFTRAMLGQRGIDYDKEMENMKKKLNIN